MTTTTTDRTKILFVDCATSGFREERDTILEVGLILADAGTLDILDAGSYVIAHDPAAPPSVPDFHDELLAECVSGGPGIASMKATEGFLLAGQWQFADIVCNRALDFDMRFLRKHMPLFASALTKGRQHLELKALELLFRAQGSAPFVNDMPRTYRGGDEAIVAYKELAHYTGVEVGL